MQNIPHRYLLHRNYFTVRVSFSSCHLCTQRKYIVLNYLSNVPELYTRCVPCSYSEVSVNEPNIREENTNAQPDNFLSVVAVLFLHFLSFVRALCLMRKRTICLMRFSIKCTRFVCLLSVLIPEGVEIVTLGTIM